MAIQDYIDHVLNALPKWFSNREREYETIRAFAEIFQDAEDQSTFWRSQADILTAVGPSSGEPDWLNQHAADKDTRRQDSETDPVLRDRLRTFPDALNLSTLEETVQSIVDAEGINGTSVVFELRPNRAFFVDMVPQSGLGGEFTGTAPDMLFKPSTTVFQINPKHDGTADNQLVLSGAATAGNDTAGTTIDGLEADSIAYQNASGVAEVDPAVVWSLERLDASGNVLDGFRQSYLSRGHRMGSQAPTVVAILPYGDLLGPHCTEATRLAVIEALRQKKGAGVRVIVECRTSP